MAKFKWIENLLEKIIFSSRCIQAPIYTGLIVGAMLYTYKFFVELIHLSATVNTISEEVLMLGILTLVDITMVLNLLIMVIIGGYATFVSRIHLEHHEDRPDWLKKINAGTLKVKLAGALVGISGIHLLKSFVDIGKKDFEQVILNTFEFSSMENSILRVVCPQRLFTGGDVCSEGRSRELLT